jgi:hypothetical protein
MATIIHNGEEISMDWKIVKGYSTTFPAGEYYIGDACYVLNRELYLYVTNYMDCFITNGTYKLGIFSTAYGDGLFKDTKDRCYGVDGGNISIIPIHLIEKDGLGHIIKFENDFEFGCKNNQTLWAKDSVNPDNSFELPTADQDEDVY